MGKNKKRGHRDYEDSSSSSSSSKTDLDNKPQNSTPHHQNHEDFGLQQMGKRPTFASYLDTSNLTPKVKLLCEIIANTPSLSVEKVLNDSGIRVSEGDVEQVLKLSYGYPGPAVKFFRWSGYQLNDKHSLYAWNLVVDLLGKNCLFDAMWDAIKTMKKEELLSLATFASVFSSYVTADRVQGAIMAFEVMDQYGCPRDIVGLNSLLSAICRDGKTQQAKVFQSIAKKRIRLDADTYAILLEGWENERNVACARQTFEEMLLDIGWDPRNVPAYESFLATLVKGPDGMAEALKLFDIINNKGCYPGMKFFKVGLEERTRKSDIKGAEVLWETMVCRKCKPDTEMYNSMISLYCYQKDADLARKFLDEMVYNGAFPDSQSYNILFQFLVKSKKPGEASPIFTEMIKNEFVPSHMNCSTAVRIYIHGGEPTMAIKVWKCMIENYNSDLEETGNLLVVGLRDIDRIPEAVKCGEDMIDRRIKLNSSTLSKLKHSLTKAGKAFVYNELLRKWKTRLFFP